MSYKSVVKILIKPLFLLYFSSHSFYGFSRLTDSSTFNTHLASTSDLWLSFMTSIGQIFNCISISNSTAFNTTFQYVEHQHANFYEAEVESSRTSLASREVPEDTFSSPWPWFRSSSSWLRSLQVLKNLLFSTRGQHLFFDWLKRKNKQNTIYLIVCEFVVSFPDLKNNTMS